MLVYALVLSLYSLGKLYLTLVILRRVDRLEDQSLEPRSDWPKLSVIAPCANEAPDEATAGQLEVALRSKAQSDYPNLEVLLVNDRSSDLTAGACNRVAESSPVVKVLHLDTLPEGWLGKVHALEAGQRATSGEWLVFSDGDVVFEAGLLPRAISYAERHNLDHLGVFPQIRVRDPVLEVMVLAFLRTLPLARPYEAANPKSTVAVGVGAFNLLRRRAWESTPGFAGIRLEVADDFALGRQAKRSGLRSGFATGLSLAEVEWYTSFEAALRSSERVGFAVIGGFSAFKLMASALAVVLIELGPCLLLAWSPAWGAGLIGLEALISFFLARWSNLSAYTALLWPLAMLLTVWGMVRGAWFGWQRRGIVWRGVLYPSSLWRK